jgi:hypothetical protein
MENRRPILGGGDGLRISNTGTGFSHVRRILEISQGIIDAGQGKEENLAFRIPHSAFRIPLFDFFNAES